MATIITVCGVLGLGRLLAEGQRDLLPRLCDLACDPRWRTREGVAMALQRLGDADMAGLLEAMEAWATDTPLVQRAAAAALCEPRLLRDPAHAARVLAMQGFSAFRFQLSAFPRAGSSNSAETQPGSRSVHIRTYLASPHRAAQLDDNPVQVAHIADDLAPRLLRRRLERARPGCDGASVGARNILDDQTQLDADRRLVGLDGCVAAWEKATGKVMPAEGQGRAAGLQLAVLPTLVEEAARQAEGAFVEIERRRNVGDVDDRVAVAHHILPS
jgi:hypothetical protein